MIAWLVSIILIPSGIMMFEAFEKKENHTYSPILNWLSDLIPRHPWAFIIIPLMISFTAIYKIKDLSTDASLMDDLRPQNKLYQDLKMTEKYFGGVLPFEVLLKLDKENQESKKTVLDPGVFSYLQDIEDLLNTELKNSRFFSLSTFLKSCLLYTSPSPRDQRGSRMPSSA